MAARSRVLTVRFRVLHLVCMVWIVSPSNHHGPKEVRVSLSGLQVAKAGPNVFSFRALVGSLCVSLRLTPSHSVRLSLLLFVFPFLFLCASLCLIFSLLLSASLPLFFSLSSASFPSCLSSLPSHAIFSRLSL